MGAGATAAAAVYALQRLGCLERVIVHNPRTPARGAALAARMGAAAAGDAAELARQCGGGGGAARRVAALVSTLPAAAAWAPPAGLLRAGCAVLDASYRPRDSALLRAAAAAGASAVEGAEMLLVQGLAANALWGGWGGAGAGAGAGGEAPYFPLLATAAAAAARAVYEALEDA